jgi:hypothetical protein
MLIKNLKKLTNSLKMKISILVELVQVLFQKKLVAEQTYMYMYQNLKELRNLGKFLFLAEKIRKDNL